MTHDMHHVGTGDIWCCSRCGFPVQVIVSDRPDGGPVERKCFETFAGYVEWLTQRYAANADTPPR